MKNLKLTVLKQPGFVGELMNVFGKGQHIQALRGNSRFIQFDFPEINLFTKVKIEPVYRLLNTFEENHGVMRLKVFHLYDDKNRSYSNISYICIRGVWIKQDRDIDLATSSNLIELI